MIPLDWYCFHGVETNELYTIFWGSNDKSSMCHHVSTQHATQRVVGGNKINTAAERDQRNEDAGKGSDCNHLTFSIPGKESQVFIVSFLNSVWGECQCPFFFENREVWNVILTGGLEADLSCYSSPRWPRYHLVLDGSFGFGWSR